MQVYSAGSLPNHSFNSFEPWYKEVPWQVGESWKQGGGWEGHPSLDVGVTASRGMKGGSRLTAGTISEGKWKVALTNDNEGLARRAKRPQAPSRYSGSGWEYPRQNLQPLGKRPHRGWVCQAQPPRPRVMHLTDRKQMSDLPLAHCLQSITHYRRFPG